MSFHSFDMKRVILEWTVLEWQVFEVAPLYSGLYSPHKRTKNKISTSKTCHFKTVHFEITKFEWDPPYIKRIEWQKVDGRGYPPSFLPPHFKKTVYVLSYYTLGTEMFTLGQKLPKKTRVIVKISINPSYPRNFYIFMGMKQNWKKQDRRYSDPKARNG